MLPSKVYSGGLPYSTPANAEKTTLSKLFSVSKALISKVMPKVADSIRLVQSEFGG